MKQVINRLELSILDAAAVAADTLEQAKRAQFEVINRLLLVDAWDTNAAATIAAFINGGCTGGVETLLADLAVEISDPLTD